MVRESLLGQTDVGGQTIQAENYVAGMAKHPPSDANAARLERLGFDPSRVVVGVAAKRLFGMKDPRFAKAKSRLYEDPLADPGHAIYVYRGDWGKPDEITRKEDLYDQPNRGQLTRFIVDTAREMGAHVVSKGYAADGASGRNAVQQLRREGVTVGEVHKVHAAYYRMRNDIIHLLQEKGVPAAIEYIERIELPKRYWWENKLFGRPDLVTLTNTGYELDQLVKSGSFKYLSEGVQAGALQTGARIAVNPSPVPEQFDRNRAMTEGDLRLYRAFKLALERRGIDRRRLEGDYEKVPLVSFGRADDSKFHLIMLELFDRHPELAKVVNGAIVISKDNDPNTPFMRQLRARYERLLADHPDLKGSVALSYQDVTVDHDLASAAYLGQKLSDRHMLNASGGVNEGFGMFWLEGAATGAIPIASVASGYRDLAPPESRYQVLSGNKGPDYGQLARVVYSLGASASLRRKVADQAYQSIAQDYLGIGPAQNHLAHCITAWEIAQGHEGGPEVAPRTVDLLSPAEIMARLVPNWQQIAKKD
jgi:glycosyltransferase involved in cell wall biosynthesis